MIQFDSWAFAYPDSAAPVIRNATCRWLPGERVVLRGDIGSGKSTLLSALMGIVPLSTGGRVDGSLAVRGLIPQRAGIAAMSASVSYLPQLVEGFGIGGTVEQDIAASLELAGLPSAEIRKRVDEVSAGLGIAHLQTRKLDRISGGERQLVALAGALARNAPVLALDEPLAQLHPSAISLVMSELNRRVADGATVILAEHEALPSALGGARLFYLADGILAPGEFQAVGVVEAERAPTTGNIVLCAQNVSLARDGREVIDNTSFEVRQGEIVGLVGANGSGKTTLLRGVAGFIKPMRGKFEMVETQNLASLLPFNPYPIPNFQWSMLPQNASSFLYADTVEKEIMTSIPSPSRREEQPPNPHSLTPLLEQFGLGQFLHRHPRDLSAGQRQLLALLIADARKPALLLLDEPTRGLSQPQRARLGAYLRKRAAEGAAILMASHDQNFVHAVANRALQIQNGRVSEHPEIAPSP